MKKVTVIIPMYNSEKYIADCLSSVDPKFADILCINDGSTDKTVEIAQKFPVKIINNNFNLGQGVCRNLGLAATNTKYVMFLDSDDMYCPDTIPLMLDAVRDCSYAVCGTRTFGEFYREYGSLKISGKRHLDEETSLLTPVVCWDKIYTTKSIKENKLCFPDLIPEDNVFWFCYTCANFWAQGNYIQKPLYNYRIVDNGSFARKNKKINPRYDTITAFFIMYDYLIFTGKPGLIRFLFESYFANFLRHYKHITGKDDDFILSRVGAMLIARDIPELSRELFPEFTETISSVIDNTYKI